MRIDRLEKQVTGDQVKVHARVRWEAVDLPDQEIFIATGARYAEEIVPNPHAFLVGALMPALQRGERRIAMGHAVCPRLKQGLRTVMGIVHHWSGGRMRPLALEMETQSQVSVHNARRTGLFLSGGIDSLACLRRHQRLYPAAHPQAIRDCLMVHGFDIGGVVARGAKYDVFERAVDHMQPVARESGVTLIPVYTNIRHLCDERELWLTYFFGAVLAAVGHAFTPRLERVHIAASYDIANLAPCGSHPLLDPEYGSADLDIRHSDLIDSRLEKLRLIADWPTAFDHLRVCLANVPEQLNCGRCEKCVRTLTGLAAIGALDRTRAFACSEITPELFDAFKITIRHREPFYREMLAPLRAQGRDDLARLIEAKLAAESASSDVG